MKVWFKKNDGRIYEVDIPDFKDGKYLMDIAKEAKKLLFNSYYELDYPSIKAAYDLLYMARKHYSPADHTGFNPISNADLDLIEKGYEEYCEALDHIMSKLITAMWITNNLEAEPEQDEEWEFHMKSKAKIEVGYAIFGNDGTTGLETLAYGKIIFGSWPRNTPSCLNKKYDYVYTTSTIWEEDGKKYYLPDFGGLSELREELKHKED